MVLKICYKLFYKYFALKDAIRDIAKSFGVEQKMEPGAKCPCEIGSPSNSSILLFIEEETWAIGAIEGVTKA